MKKLLKRLGLTIGILVVLFLAVAIIVPLVVDVDKYRPQITDAANQQLNGKLALGKLRLSLWGQVRVEIEGLNLTDAASKDVLEVKDAYFHLPFWPLLSGSPILTFKMNEPMVHVWKDRSGKLNLMGLKKASQSAPTETASGKPASSPAPGKDGADQDAATKKPLPAIVSRARLGVELKNALITYADHATGLNAQVKDLNVVLKDISLSHPTELEVWADLDTQLGKTFSLKGPARMTAEAEPKLLADGSLNGVNLNAKMDMDSVEMSAPGLFKKSKGMATNLELVLSATPAETKIEKCVAHFFNAQVNLLGTITMLESKVSPAQAPSVQSSKKTPLSKTPSPEVPKTQMAVKMKMDSNVVQLKPWVELVPMLKEFELGGSFQFSGEASGPSDKLGYKAKFSVVDLTAKAPKLKAQPKIDATVNVITDQIESFLLTLKAPANDLRVQGKLVSFASPRLDVAVNSTGMDLDALVDFPPPAPAAPAGKQEEAPASKPSAGPTADYDKMLDPVRENKALAGFVGNVGVDMKFLKAQGVKLTDVTCKLGFKDLAAGLENCGFNIFGGGIRTAFSVQMKPKVPTYQMNAQVIGLDIKQAVESKFALFKNTVTGKASFSMKGQGASLNPEPAMSNLKANGNLKVDQAVFATIDVMKMAGEALNKTINQVGEKIPAVKGKAVNLPNGASKYEFVSSDFTIDGGKFSAPNFYAKALPNQGIDIKGATTVGMIDKSLKTSWDIIDTYNLTRMRDISINQNGVQVEHLFSEGGSPVHFPVSAGCTITAPCYSYTQVPEALGKVALDNVGKAVAGAVTARAKEEARKQAEAAIKRVVPPSVQENVRDKLKKFF